MSKPTMHRVAVTVFVEAQGVNERDAADGAELAIRKALAKEMLRAYPYPLDSVVLYPGRDNERVLEPVIVHDIMETGTALGNGYLWTRPTTKGFPSLRRPSD